MKRSLCILLIVAALVLGGVGGFFLGSGRGVTPISDLPVIEPPYDVAISGIAVTAFAQGYLPENSGVTLERVDFAPPNVISAAGYVSGDDLAQMTGGLSALVRSFLPDRLDFATQCTVTCVEGRLEIRPELLTVGKFSVNASLLPAAVTRAITEAAMAQMGKLPEIGSVSCGENLLFISMK